MIRYLVRRLLGLCATLLAASFVVYSSVYLAPGSVEDTLFAGRRPTGAMIAAARERYGLDQPFLLRYFSWLGQVLRGDLGTSLISQQPVTEKLAGPLVTTLSLVAYAAVLIVVFGLGLGVVSALNPGPIDAATTGIVSVATAVPAFVASYLLIAVFSVRLGWFPAFGMESGPEGHLKSLTLPAFALAIISSGLVARVSRAAMIEQHQSEHVRTAEVRGISRRRTVRSHVLRNAAGPIATVTGLQIAALFAGAIVVEQAFGLGGLGQLLIGAVQQKDYAVVQAVCLIIVAAFVLLNLAAELVGAALDPRARPWRRG